MQNKGFSGLTLSNTIFILLLFLNITTAFSQKEVYMCSTIKNMNLTTDEDQFSWARSAESDNFVIFWEDGFGDDPSTAESPYTVDIDNVLEIAEKSYALYRDTLKFVIEGESLTDDYKMVIFIYYTTDWTSYGSGEDNMIGALYMNPDPLTYQATLAHEVGHAFQYMVYCDNNNSDGWRYGFGDDGAGGNVYWENCAQWQSYKVYPDEQFTNYYFDEYISSTHMNIFHETPRYANYFLQDYQCYLHGMDIIGRLWRETEYPEDPIDTYIRLNSLTQSEFNDEMYDGAARLATWDIPSIKSYGADYITRAQPEMNLSDDEYWVIDTSDCLENYGYNVIKLNPPSEETEVKVYFEGLVGDDDFRELNPEKGGWRYGFVALLDDGTRVYSDMGTANMENSINPSDSLSFTCPDDCSKLLLIVTGAPQEHWHHEWDSDNTNDEQWPYQVKFANTNLLGYYDNDIYDLTLTYDVNMDPQSDYTSTSVQVDENSICQAFSMPTDDMVDLLDSDIIYYAINPDGSFDATSTASAPGHWFNSDGETTSWGSNSYIFSELSLSEMTFNIGQYPDACEDGDTFTIKQALIYTNSSDETAQITFIFNITIGDVSEEQEISLSAGWNLVSLYVEPDDASVTSVFPNATVIKNAEEYYLSSQAEYLNTLSDITAGTGYLVYNSTGETITVTGTPTFTTTLSLSEGWNLVGVPVDTEFEVSGLPSETIIAKDFSGFYEPGDNQSGLESFEPGKAYYIDVSGDCDLEY